MNVRRQFNYPNSVLFFAFWMPLSTRISTIAIFACILLLISEFFRFPKSARIPKELLLLPLLFLTYSVSIFFLSNDHSFTWFEHKASLLAFPIIFVGASKLKYIWIFRAFITGTVGGYLICLFNAVYESLNWVDNSLVFNPLVDSSRGFFEAIMYEGNYFFSNHFSFLIQTSYFGLYSILALSILWILNIRLFKKSILILFSALLLLGIVQTLSISAFIGMIICILCLIVFYLKNRVVKMFTLLVVLGLVVLGSFWQPRVRLMLEDLKRNEMQLNPQGRYGMMLRLLSWDASIEVIRENGFFGVGLPDAQKELNKMYKEKAYVYPLKEHLNSHNQYLQMFIECGIIGLVLLALMFYALIKRAMRATPQLKILIATFTLLIAFNFLFESYFSRYVGLSFFCFFYCLFITYRESRKELDEIGG